MLRELYCIFLSSLRYIKIWIVMFYRGLKFPHTAVVLLALETDAACTSLCDHFARRKSTMFVLVWCYKPTCDTEQDLWKYWLPEGWFSSGSTSLWVMVTSARSVGWGRNEELTLLYLVPWPSALMCSMETRGSETFLINSTYQNPCWCSR